MDDRYGDTHYRVFHVLMPEVVHTDILEGFMVAVRHGRAPEVMALMWGKAAREVLGIPPLSALPPELVLDAASFEVCLEEVSAETTLVLITAPPVSGPVQAGFAAVALNEAVVGARRRYFTVEAPMMEFLPWMVGEWLGPGRRENLGEIADLSTEGLSEFVQAQLGLADTPPRRAVAGVEVTRYEHGDHRPGLNGRRASWPARMTARALRAVARGQRNAGGAWFPLRRTRVDSE